MSPQFPFQSNQNQEWLLVASNPFTGVHLLQMWSKMWPHLQSLERQSDQLIPEWQDLESPSSRVRGSAARAGNCGGPWRKVRRALQRTADSLAGKAAGSRRQ